ncbi:60S ribosomal protein L27, mitochondrial [Elasticomyces elasticus]|nr:60S ribosomal protein L27, mitochondrial [Elasticomyces elasticus]KAK3639290.1 60S ribosomal protein L27, mitochondrial [Elasticomyces elasticus]KAK4915703.1 60S ribosomal protein L27, mitochondrial [Elasticomyces elasticus]KAK5746290.1 60S ribosomal protein L27, mitochondrial [Elasticomyces elasticus]
MQPTPVLQRAIRRLALTTKQGPHNFYKGNRTGAMGSHTKYGGYRIDWKKVRTYVCPEGLGEFNLREGREVAKGASLRILRTIGEAERSEALEKVENGEGE